MKRTSFLAGASLVLSLGLGAVAAQAADIMRIQAVGEVGARCDTEAANTLTLNLMHEIVTGKRTVDEAREMFAESTAAYTLGRPCPYSERLLFEPPNGGTTDPDEGIIAGAMVDQMVAKAKDMLVGEPEDRERS